jgi:hypothetical protein
MEIMLISRNRSRDIARISHVSLVLLGDRGYNSQCCICPEAIHLGESGLMMGVWSWILASRSGRQRSGLYNFHQTSLHGTSRKGCKILISFEIPERTLSRLFACIYAHLGRCPSVFRHSIRLNSLEQRLTLILRARYYKLPS